MGVKRTPPFENYPEWSTARFFGFLRSLLRQGFSRYPVKYQVLNSSARLVTMTDDEGEVVLYKSGKRVGEPRTYKAYTCAKCNNEFRQKDVQVDHITPAGSLKDFDDLPGFARRLYCAPSGLQVLCTECHNIKTKEDKAK